MSKNKPAFNADDLIQRTEPKPPAPTTPIPQPIDKQTESVGIKGLKSIKRYNMAFDSDIYDYLEARKWAERSTIKDLVNKIIREEMERHPVK